MWNYSSNGSAVWFTGWAAGLWILFIVALLIGVAALVCQIVGMWKTFTKAKLPGWAAIIPYFNTFTIVRMAGLELWWFVALALASASAGFGVGWIVLLAGSFFTNLKVAKSFGKEVGFAVGLTLVAPVFWLILGFGEAKYKGPAGPYKMPEMKHGK
jgi:hypothetical protein